MLQTPSSERREAALRFLASRIDYERGQSMPSSEAALKLDRMRELLRRLGNPQADLPIVHVAGTKGKGSTSAMIAAVLSAAGYRTGLFTSPHLDRVEERIVIDSGPCSAEDLAGLVESVRPAIEGLDREAARQNPAEHGPTYFEILTAMALLHFAGRQVDAAVLEVGLGGRLDSTNVCTPLASVITSISFDHTQQLGGSLAAIAAEKAGIIKPGVPVISGVTGPEPREVVRRIAAERGCRLVELGVDFDFEYRPPRHLERAPSPATFDFRCLASAIGSQETKNNSRGLTAPGGAAGESATPESTFRGLLAPGYLFEKLAIALLGRHQAANAAIVLAVMEELRRAGWTIPKAAIRRGLAEVAWPARVEVVARRPCVVLDAAHNAASIGALVEVLDDSFSARRRLLVFATTQGKDVPGMLQRLLGRFDQVILTRYLENPRGIPPEELQALAAACWGGSPTAAPAAVSPLPLGEGQGVRAAPGVEIAATPAEAWDTIHRLAQPDNLVCITGSFFLAAEMRRQIAARPLAER